LPGDEFNVAAAQISWDLAGDNGSAFAFRARALCSNSRHAHAGGLEELAHLLEGYPSRTDARGFLQNLGNVAQGSTDGRRGRAERSPFYCSDRRAL
jgi:hypothetical protein